MHIRKSAVHFLDNGRPEGLLGKGEGVMGGFSFGYFILYSKGATEP